MPIVNIKGVGKAQFPDGMSVDSIRDFLRKKYIQQISSGESSILQAVDDVAAPYNPSLVEKAGSSIASALKSTGLISDDYRAQEIGKNLTSIGEFLPVIGDISAIDDATRAYNKGNYGEAALSAVGTLPILGDMAIFAGVLAKNADLGALNKAKLWEDTGKNRDEIWKETGWVNDKGDWKFEIDDSSRVYDPTQAAHPKDIEVAENKIKDLISRRKEYTAKNSKLFLNKDTPDYVKADITNKLKAFSNDTINAQTALNRMKSGGQSKILIGDAMQSPALENYPDIKDASFKHEDAPMEFGGSFDGSSIEINRAMGLGQQESTAQHELQHFIQSKEGFIGGGNPAMMDAELANTGIEGKRFYQAAEVKELLDDGLTSSEVIDAYKGMPELGLVKDILKDKELLRSSSSQLKNKGSFDAYQRLAGEAEARNVQTRLDWTPEQRRATPPWESLDVPENELIYRKDSGLQGLQLNQSALPMDEVKQVTSYNDMFDFTPEQMAQQLRSSKPENVIDGVYIEQTKFGEKRFNPDGSVEIVKGGEVLRRIEPQDADMAYKNKIMKNEGEKPEVQAAQEKRRVEFEVERARQQAQDAESYKMQHTAPTREDNPSGDDLTDTFGGDIYTGNALRYFGTGSSYDNQAINIIQGMKGKPNKTVTIYRAVPKDVKTINASDWVTTTKEYARDHMEGEKGWHILSKKVKAKDIATDGNSIHEFGYDPEQ